MSYAGDVTPTEAWELLENDENTVLVDCRTTAEWNFVGVPDLEIIEKKTIFVEWSMFPSGEPNPRFVEQLRDSGITDDNRVLFICRSGNRSIGAAEAATAAGIKQSFNVLDGFEGHLDEYDHRGATGWRALNLPWRQS
ncbi:rhodanese-like domain-containing protein [Gordonia sp. (in: high G+C Gram-positive bacteria)]|uniref:rhodanese-like domain-containing protein n=1 Tax=Gordonia sp. (in: high G+C Gram-positive bacteria) TaxID=84139 RepID=UPI0039E4A04C